MTPDDVARVGAMIAAVRDRDEFAADFYTALWAAEPGLREMFPDDMFAQRRKFRAELDALITAIRDIEAFEGRALSLGERHGQYGVRAHHYALVRDAILTAFDRQLGDALTDADREAWARAYNLVAEVMQEGAASGTARADAVHP